MKIDFQRALAAPEGAHEVIMVRHGACDPPPPDGLIDGRSDPSLNARGRAEAAAAGERIAAEQVAAVFVSQLRRTAETAAPILAAHAPLEAHPLADLGEIYLGEWEGHGIHSRGASGDPELARVFAEQRWDLVPGAEPLDGFGERVRRGLEQVADAALGGVAVAVTHAAVIAEFCRQITGSDPFAFLYNTNGSLTRTVRMPDGRWILMSYNDTEHLRAQREREAAAS